MYCWFKLIQEFYTANFQGNLLIIAAMQSFNLNETKTE